MTVKEIAFAKINLALHVRVKRDDGYHELETLFAFLDNGDVLTAQPAEADRFEVYGEFADVLDNPFGNLVARALSALPRTQGLHVTLEKNLPVAAGLGGGSADAGALFRIVDQVHGLPDGWEVEYGFDPLTGGDDVAGKLGDQRDLGLHLVHDHLIDPVQIAFDQRPQSRQSGGGLGRFVLQGNHV